MLRNSLSAAGLNKRSALRGKMKFFCTFLHSTQTINKRFFAVEHIKNSILSVVTAFFGSRKKYKLLFLFFLLYFYSMKESSSYFTREY